MYLHTVFAGYDHEAADSMCKDLYSGRLMAKYLSEAETVSDVLLFWVVLESNLRTLSTYFPTETYPHPTASLYKKTPGTQFRV